MNVRSYSFLSLASGILIAIFFGHSEASETSDTKHFELHSRLNQLETDMQQVRTETAYENFGARAASAAPVIDGYDFFATADFLWWKLYEGGTDFLIENEDPSSALEGNISRLHFHWDPGFRIGIGTVFDYDRWELYTQFTHYQTYARKEEKPSEGETFSGIYGIPGTSVAGSSHAKWHIDFSELDLILGRSYFVSKFLSLEPFFGLSSAWINQHRKFRYNKADGNNIELIHGKNEFWGLGPRVGINTQFFFGSRFSLYGNISGALLWGNFDVQEKARFQVTNSEIYNLTSSRHKMAPTVDFDVGIAYEANIHQNMFHYLISLGLESQYWWAQNQFSTFYPSSFSFKRVNEDLSTLGLTLQFRLDF